MARLILMFNKQVIKEYPFVKTSISIGRKEDNGIVIDNLAVSGYHARIDKAGDDYILTAVPAPRLPLGWCPTMGLRSTGMPRAVIRTGPLTIP